jgi:gas vesicle protein
MDRENGRFGAFVAGFVLGGLVGATIGVFKAPKPGEESREELRTKGIELRDTAEQSVDDALASIKSTARDVSSRAEELRTQSQSAMDEAQAQWAAAAESIKNLATEAIKEVKKSVANSSDEKEEPVAQKS